MRKIFAVEHFAWRQMKENYQIYVPSQFHWRPHSVGGDPQLSHKKMKTLFLEYVKKSKTDFDFFPDYFFSHLRKMKEPSFGLMEETLRHSTGIRGNQITAAVAKIASLSTSENRENGMI